MIAWIVSILAGTYAVASIEARLHTGSWKIRVTYPFNGKSGQPEPKDRDMVFYNTAPFLFLAAVMLAAAALPLAPHSFAVNLATGSLFVSAALAYVMVALVLSGWAPNTELSQIGGWRFLGQFIGYSMPIVMSITAVAMRAQSLSTLDVVRSQAQLWNLLYQPIGAVVFCISVMALAFLPPFDLPTARSEIKGGVFSGFYGWRLAALRLSRLVLILVAAWTVAVFYLGGWTGPLLPPWVWSSLKILAVSAAMLGAGLYVPRMTIDRLLAAAWKAAIPLALLNIFVVGLLILGGII